MTYADREDSDQTAHMCSLISVFTFRTNLCDTSVYSEKLTELAPFYVFSFHWARLIYMHGAENGVDIISMNFIADLPEVIEVNIQIIGNSYFFSHVSNNK